MLMRNHPIGWLIVGLVVAVSLVPTLQSVVGNSMPLSASFHDDAYYYFRIAENIAEGKGSTFDGINATNGYQPLWCWLLVPVAAVKHLLFPRSSLQLYGISLSLLAACLAYLVYSLASHRGGVIGGAIAGCLLIYGRVQTLFTGGMEAAILGVFVLLYIKLLLEREQNMHTSVLFGLVGAGLVLSRVDHAIVLAVLGLFPIHGIWIEQRRRALALAAPIVLLPILSLVLYFASNHILFGHTIPISGAIKTAGELPIRWELWVQDRSVTLLCFSAIVVLALFSWLTGFGRNGDKWERLNFFWSAGNAAYLLFLLISVRWVLANWYFVSPLLQLVIVLGWGAARIFRLGRLNKTVFRVGALAVLIAFIVWSQYTRFTRLNQSFGTFQSEMVRAADWCNRNLDSTAVIGLADAGYFGYHVRRTVLNLDGLVNGWEYVEACRSGTGVEHLRRQGLTHVATVFGSQVHRGEELLRYDIPAVFAIESEGNRFEASKEALLYSSFYGEGRSFRGEFMIWEDRTH